MHERFGPAIRQKAEQAAVATLVRYPEAAMRHIEALFDIRGRENLERAADMHAETVGDGAPPVWIAPVPEHLGIADNFGVPYACGMLRDAIRARGFAFDGFDIPATSQLQSGAKGPVITAFWDMMSRQHAIRYGVNAHIVARPQDLKKESDAEKRTAMEAQTRQTVKTILQDMSRVDNPRGLLIFPTGSTSSQVIEYGLMHRAVERFLGKRPIIMLPMVVDQTDEIITNESRHGKAEVTPKALLTLGLDVARLPIRPIGVVDIREPIDLTAALAKRGITSRRDEHLFNAVNGILMSGSRRRRIDSLSKTS